MPSSDSSGDVLLDRLAAEFVERHRSGECPPLTEYTARYPDLAKDIRELFPALVRIERLKPVVDDLTGDFAAPAAGVPRLERLGEYRILREIGRGGMGVVYEAEQESLGRQVALKVLSPQALLNGTYLERFRREARAAAKLHHTNIVPVFGVGEADGMPYYAMQFIRGEGLDKVLADLGRLRQGDVPALVSDGSVAHGLLSGQFAAPPTLDDTGASAGSLPLRNAAGASPSSTLSGGPLSSVYHRSVAQIGVQVAEALAHAHKQGVLHRDVKPSNLLLDGQGRVWVTDFGLAKAEGTEELTQAGDIVGTLRFMAPERFDGHSLPQSDVYGLGLTLYELLTLRSAFADTNKGRLIDKVLHEPPVPPRKLDPRVPRNLETIVLKCVAKDPAERYASAEAVAEDLHRFLADRPIKARRSSAVERLGRWCRRNPWLAGLSAAVLLLLLVVAVGSTVFAVRLQEELGRRHRAERDQLEKLFSAQVAEARARRYSGRPGQRFKSLEALRQAVELARQLGKPAETFDELRNEAISALCLPDIDDGLSWKTACPSPWVAFDSTGQSYVQLDGKGHAYYCRLVNGKEERQAEFAVEGEPTNLGEWHSADLRFLALRGPHVDGKGHDWIKLWDCAGPKAKLVREDRAGVTDNGASFRPDGRQLAVNHPDGTLTVYDTETGTVVRNWRSGAPSWVVAFHPRLPRLAVVRGDGVRFYNVESGAMFPLRLVHPGTLSSVAWHPDGRQLATGCLSTKQILLWDTQTGKQLTEPWQGLTDGASRVRFNATGDRLVSNDYSGILRLWDAGTGRELFNTVWGGGADWLPHFSRNDQFLEARSRRRNAVFEAARRRPGTTRHDRKHACLGGG